MTINDIPIKIIEGCISFATENKARTSFSPSPTNFDVNELAEILKNAEIQCFQLIAN
jgi:hypothetical protein